MSMNEEVKAEWTAALRSGNYRQAKHYLSSGEGDCCLGVLCKLAVLHDIIPSPVAVPRLSDEGHYYKYASGAYSTLPPQVMEWAGLDKWNPNVPAPEGMPDDHVCDGQTTLAELNDTDYSFDEIADVIDAEL